MTDDLTPGKRIKQVRESMGLTQQQFANLIAITQPSLARIETDNGPPKETLVRYVELIAACKPLSDYFDYYTRA